MRGYKVLRRSSGNLYSAVMYADAANVHYRTTKENKPRKDCGPLCVFATIRAAETFIRDEFPINPYIVEIWEVEYKPSRKRRIWDTDGEEFNINRLPEDTRLADSVKLIKRYENQNNVSGR